MRFYCVWQAEKFGNSFVLEAHLSKEVKEKITQAVSMFSVKTRGTRTRVQFSTLFLVHSYFYH